MPPCAPWISQAVVPGLSFSWMTQRASVPSAPGKVAGPAGRALALARPEACGDGAGDVTVARGA